MHPMSGRPDGFVACPDRPCILDTDSSDVAYGSVLSQLVDGQERPIAFFSRVMSPTTPGGSNKPSNLKQVMQKMEVTNFRNFCLKNSGISGLGGKRNFRKSEFPELQSLVMIGGTNGRGNARKMEKGCGKWVKWCRLT